MRFFISHAQRDQEFAARLARELEGAGHDVWSAERKLLPGDNWASAIGKALETADALVAVISPDAVKSANVLREWEYALGRERLANRVFPVEVRSTRDAPWILERLQVVRTESAREAARKILASLGSVATSGRARERATPSR
jgi:hypothetical protein